MKPGLGVSLLLSAFAAPVLLWGGSVPACAQQLSQFRNVEAARG